ncbi:HlyD family efflux transporter periplasmic adaptor subunit [Geomonas agri]|uniref:HlyD family efflux transporter periplasmic adaptor subunit n=1 Tax=Geomonas agri TaxID=2873702 RepID=UPI001CD2E91B|nr:HlyD family efflux transporter periplasmic adaptor subunit [Geomonas agri]
MVNLSLPPLRQELDLLAAPVARDGSPGWTLHDPANNRYYLLAWPAFEMLSRWHLGSVAVLLESVNRETTLEATESDLAEVLTFLQRNFLLDLPSAAGTDYLVAAAQARKVRGATWLLHNYLFFRVPLFRPQRFLDATAPLIGWIYTRAFLLVVLVAAALGLYFTSRQWDLFVHAFTSYRGGEALFALWCIIPLAKVFHEFGHAFTAHRFGCRIPAMGIAFVVMTPMLFTDTNEVWKLTSRRQRLAVGAAGVLAEFLLALAALWAWLLLPDGPWRGAAFMLATTTLFMTLALNASPFMRFDGYFFLSDLLGIPNLHTRSFAFGRWWLRERMFGLKDPPPEPASRGRRYFLVAFAYAVWAYRFSVFIGIALLVYHYFFKALGIFLFGIEIGWFVLLPCYREAADWWKMRDRISFNVSLLTTLLLVAGAIALLVVPWQGDVAAPGILMAAREQQVAAPRAGMVLQDIDDATTSVRRGELLTRLQVPELEAQIKRAGTSAAVSAWQAARQSFDPKLLSQGMVPLRRYEEDRTEQAGLVSERNRLTLQAPFDGTIVARNDEAGPGVWLAAREPLFLVADTTRNRIDSYVGERDLKRLQPGARARFLPDASEFGSVSCTVADIDQVNITEVADPMLASASGGPLATRPDARGVQIPLAPVFRVRLDNCAPRTVPLVPLRGVVHIEAQKQSVIGEIMRNAAALLVRESNL